MKTDNPRLLQPRVDTMTSESRSLGKKSSKLWGKPILHVDWGRPPTRLRVFRGFEFPHRNEWGDVVIEIEVLGRAPFHSHQRVYPGVWICGAYGGENPSNNSQTRCIVDKRIGTSAAYVLPGFFKQGIGDLGFFLNHYMIYFSDYCTFLLKMRSRKHDVP